MSVQRARRKIALLVGGGLFAYALVNMAFVSGVTTLHRLSVVVEVIDGDSGAGLPDASVSWVAPDAEPEPLGRTDAGGHLSVVRVVQQQPLWRWPMLGTLRLEPNALQVAAPGFAVARAELGRVPMAEPTLRLELRLTRMRDGDAAILPAPMNCMLAIHPYRYEGLWVFDDERVGLSQEPFVSGADVILDRLVESIPDAEKGFTLLFSATPFPGYQAEFDWVREEHGGNWYRLAALDMEGWLCPALFKYFDAAPPRIYAQCKARSR